MGEIPKELGEIPKHVGEILRHLGEKPKKCGRKSAEYLGGIVREKRKPIKSGDEKLPNEMGEKVRK